MLILTRRIGETIVINDDIRITIVSVRGNQIRVGIQAPREVPVHREEVYGTPKPTSVEVDKPARAENPIPS